MYTRVNQTQSYRQLYRAPADDEINCEYQQPDEIERMRMKCNVANIYVPQLFLILFFFTDKFVSLSFPLVNILLGFGHYTSTVPASDPSALILIELQRKDTEADDVSRRR